MNPTELAQRNYTARQAQLSRLRPMRHEARAKIEVLRKAQGDAGNAREAIELMSNLKHVPNFFPTPRTLVDRMIEEAALAPGMSVLEPSAGKGDIAKAVLATGCKCLCIEFNRTLADHLLKNGFDCLCSDFLDTPTWLVYHVPRSKSPEFDRVLMNPPFERGIDEKHIRHAFGFLKSGGRLVAIACSTTGSKLEQWAADNGGFVEPLPPDTFKTSERPTAVNTCLIVADKL